MIKHVVLVALAATPFLSSCGSAGPDSAPLAVERLSGDQAQPKPAVAPGTLSRIADSPSARRRIGYVNVAELEAIADGPDSQRVMRLVLGSGAVRLEGATGRPTTATQIGDATILDGETRTVVGGTPAQRSALEQTAPQPNAIEAETPSAVQSCLGDPAAQTIVGSAVLGSKSAIGVSLIDTADAPSGPKLLICVAPHFFRDLHRAEGRLQRLFPSDGPADRRPIISEQEIGEREIVGASVALDQVDPKLVDELLRGGPRLVAIGAPGPAGDAGADSGPH